MDAGARGVEHQLADGNGHAARALIAQAEDALVVGDHDEADVALEEIAEALRDLAAVGGAEEQSARAAVDMAVALAGQADGRGVDDRREAFEVLDQQPVEQDFVAVEQGDEADILFQRIVLLKDVLQLHRDLLLDGEHCGRQQAFDPELSAFGAGEGDVFVLGRVTQNLLAARPVDVRSWFVFHSSRCRGHFLIILAPRELAPFKKLPTRQAIYYVMMIGHLCAPGGYSQIVIPLAFFVGSWIGLKLIIRALVQSLSRTDPPNRSRRRQSALTSSIDDHSAPTAVGGYGWWILDFSESLGSPPRLPLHPRAAAFDERLHLFERGHRGVARAWSWPARRGRRRIRPLSAGR